ncbi:Hypothetical protein POVR1_LOCUS299 [uncultured virus]|nr:Hypothetical protein POVR1_LOCUS299 [uncultured virus]
MPNFRDIVIRRLFPLIELDPTKTLEDFLTSSSVEYAQLKNQVTTHLSNEGMESKMKILRYNFLEELYLSGGSISGSFLLDCLYGTDYHNDIDIYEPDDCDTYTSENVSTGYFEFGGSNVRFTQFLYQSGFYQRGYSRFSDQGSGSDQVRSFRTETMEDPRNHLQVIVLKMRAKSGSRSCVPQFVNSTFDLDICKCLFNGRDLMIRSWKKLMYRYDYIKCHMHGVIFSYPYEGCDGRLGYADRDEIIDQSVTEKRLVKYSSRGFNIQHHPEIPQIINMLLNVVGDPKYQPKTENGCPYRAVTDGQINLDQFYLD